MKISMFAFLLLLQAFVACQQQTEEALCLTAGIGFAATPGKVPSPPTAAALESNLLLQSLDGGQTWQAADAGLPAGLRIRELVACGGDIFLNTEKASSLINPAGEYKALLFRCEADASPTLWQLENGMFQPENIFHVYPGKDGAYAYNHQDGFFQKLTGLDSWMPLFPGLKNEWAHTIFEAANGAVFIGSNNGILKSTDEGRTWKNVFSTSLAYHFSESGGVLFADAHNGILRSTDGGEHWEWAMQQPGMVARSRQMEGGILAMLYQTTDNFIRERLLASTDGGKTWQDLDENLPHFRRIFDARQAGKYLFCSLDSGVYRSADQGKSWELMLKAPDKTIRLAVSGEVLYAVFVEDGC